MGLFDFFNSDERKKNEVALQIDLEAGVVERCRVCGDLFDEEHDERLPAADAAAHEAFDRNDPRVAIFQGNREDLLSRLRSARKPLPFRCPCVNS
jgi:hypothetical protein